jgi:hypothetical protein
MNILLIKSETEPALPDQGKYLKIAHAETGPITSVRGHNWDEVHITSSALDYMNAHVPASGIWTSEWARVHTAIKMSLTNNYPSSFESKIKFL